MGRDPAASARRVNLASWPSWRSNLLSAANRTDREPPGRPSGWPAHFARFRRALVPPASGEGQRPAGRRLCGPPMALDAQWHRRGTALDRSGDLKGETSCRPARGRFLELGQLLARLSPPAAREGRALAGREAKWLGTAQRARARHNLPARAGQGDEMR